MIELIPNYKSKNLSIYVFNETDADFLISFRKKYNDNFVFKITLNDGVPIFSQYDQIFFGEKIVGFSHFRIGEVYTKDNGSIDAKSNHSEFSVIYTDIFKVDVICESNKNFLRFNLKSREHIDSVLIPEDSNLSSITIRINEIIKLKSTN